MHTAIKVIQDGFYQIVLEDKTNYIFRVRTNDADSKSWPGQQVIAKAKRYGSRDYTNFGIIQDGQIVRQFVRWGNADGRDPVLDAANLLFSGDMEEAGRVYARSFGRCYVCNRTLTDQHSLATGIGPDCAGTRKHVEIGEEPIIYPEKSLRSFQHDLEQGLYAGAALTRKKAEGWHSTELLYQTHDDDFVYIVVSENPKQFDTADAAISFIESYWGNENRVCAAYGTELDGHPIDEWQIIC